MVKLIAAIGRNRELGKDNSLLWKLPNDLKNFKELTIGSAVVMGRKTFESIGRPLPGRRNIVVSRDGGFAADGTETACSFEKAMELCFWDCFVIGGAQIYELAMPTATKIYLTRVDGDFEADCYFPDLGEEWLEVNEQSFVKDERNEYNHSFVEFERCKF